MHDTQPKPKRRWLQFSPRTLLILITLLSALLVWWSCAVRPQHEAVAPHNYKELLGKSQDEVKAVLGEPDQVLDAGIAAPPSGATEEERKKYFSNTEAHKWLYERLDVAIIFNAYKKVISVTNKEKSGPW